MSDSFNNLKRDRNESNHGMRKRLKTRSLSPIIPIKQEEPPESFHVQDSPMTDPIESKKPKKKTKKQTSYKNIFWGSQQSAWMGSLRCKGLTIRSCSRKSDLMAAKILNTRCRESGVDPPNPEAGFLTNAEQVTQPNVGPTKRTRSTRKKVMTKSDRNIVGKRKKPQRRGQSKKTSPLRNIFWGTQQQAWMGNIRVRGTIVRSCSRKSDIQAAKILNSRCREKGIDPPNPDVGFVDQNTESKYLSGSSSRVKQEPNAPKKPKKPTSGQFITDATWQDYENQDPKQKIKVKTDQSAAALRKFNNVEWSSFEQAWIGCVRVNSEQHLTSKSDISAVLAAKMLNSKCHEIGFPLPNPEVGLMTGVGYNTYNSSSAYNNFNFNADQDYGLPYKSSNNIMDHLRLDPPTMDLDEDDYRSTALLFQLLNDLLPPTVSPRENIGTSLLMDDLPVLSPKLF